MRKSDKDRALKKKKKHAAIAKKIACKHERRTPYLIGGVIFGLTPSFPPKLICVDCGELITMLSNTVSSTAISEEKSKKSIQLKN